MFGRHDAKFLTLALHCMNLLNPLYELVERNGVKRETPRRPVLGVSHTDEAGQFLMFPIPMEKREEYGTFARNLAGFLPENIRSNKSDFIFDHTLEFTNYEFFAFFRRVENKLAAAIIDLNRLAAGEQLEDYEPLIKFLSMLHSMALHEHDGQRGGCF